MPVPPIPQHFQDTNTYCGAASGMMVIDGLVLAGLAGQGSGFEPDQRALFAQGGAFTAAPGLGTVPWSLQPSQVSALLNARLHWPARVPGTLSRRYYEAVSDWDEGRVLTSVRASLALGFPVVILTTSDRAALHWMVIRQESPAAGGAPGFYIRDPLPLSYSSENTPHVSGAHCPCRAWGAGGMEVDIWKSEAAVLDLLRRAFVVGEPPGKIKDRYFFAVVAVARLAGTGFLVKAGRRVLRSARRMLRKRFLPVLPAARVDSTPAEAQALLKESGLTGDVARQHWQDASGESEPELHPIHAPDSTPRQTLAVFPETAGRRILTWLNEHGALWSVALVKGWPGVLPPDAVAEKLRAQSVTHAGADVPLADCTLTVEPFLVPFPVAAGLHSDWPCYRLTVQPPPPAPPFAAYADLFCQPFTVPAATAPPAP